VRGPLLGLAEDELPIAGEEWEPRRMIAAILIVAVIIGLAVVAGRENRRRRDQRACDTALAVQRAVEEAWGRAEASWRIPRSSAPILRALLRRLRQPRVPEQSARPGATPHRPKEGAMTHKYAAYLRATEKPWLPEWKKHSPFVPPFDWQPVPGTPYFT